MNRENREDVLETTPSEKKRKKKKIAGEKIKAMVNPQGDFSLCRPTLPLPIIVETLSKLIE